ncbi:hypothetical protein [Stutzerimonas balearica]|uniref:hypothetical protein n=1 Tax=Stutzerimonas balearica TaxID=74829 RepID=UPI0028B100FF|nr:hypothetical protein [Stutzerimonas balearica]
MAVSVIAKFIADEWFKIMAILCFVVLMAALTLELKIDNILVALLACAGIFFGLAEMAFRPYREEIIEHPYGVGLAKLTGRPRRVNASGCILVAISCVLVAAGAWRGWILLSSGL